MNRQTIHNMLAANLKQKTQTLYPPTNHPNMMVLENASTRSKVALVLIGASGSILNLFFYAMLTFNPP